MKIKGFTYGYDGRAGAYRSEEAKQSRKRLFETGVNWICLSFAVELDDIFSRQIRFRFGKDVSDRDLMAVIKDAHEHGVKVCLKPMVNSADFIWRARITFPDAEQEGKDRYWDEWFESYGAFMCYYAELAEECGAEMLCIGCEMCGTEHKEAHWRTLIGRLRNIYHGELSYNTNHGHEDAIAWFDAVDYLGTSAYFPVGTEGKTGVEDMCAEWEKIKTELKELVQKWNKPLLFMEIGCRSAKGCSSMPWDFEHRELPHDEEEQAAFYESCLRTFGSEEWFAGCFWWDWSTKIYDDEKTASEDNGFNIHLKKAEEVLKEWYAKL